MNTVTVDRSGRIVIPQAIRQRHGWQAGTILELRDGPDGFAAVTWTTVEPAPPGWSWQDGMLVCTATATGDLTDLCAMRDELDAQPGSELLGLP